ncbi:hypothetical protein [Luteibacter sp. 22Crub2.1]|uniref:hypothetical protein n=1 Tax=Luteibacter sp. 22Crub2.1 TaxID=1283288 RepID=UPI0009A70F56|nr:hypothetical protein [Luteibacter sp. 22Crub2.1]SKB82268.1 hypothetical protein SAMN05660880_02782 [Luteibacter sp. 22Crub2.1]
MNAQTPIAADDGWRIARVSLHVDSLVYTNGRQQAYVRLYIEAESNFEPVKLTQSEKDSVRLIDYTNPEIDIPFSEDGDERYRGWSAQRDFRGYEPHPGLGRRPDTTLAGGDYLEFYVDATADALRAPLALAFRVTGDNKWTYRTDGYVFDQNGQAGAYNNQYDTGADKSVRPMTPPVYTPAEFRLGPAGTRGTGSLRAGIFNDVHLLFLQPNASPGPTIRSMRCSPAGMIHWKDALPSTENPCFTGYASPGENDIHWDDRVPQGSQPLPLLDKVYPEQGVIMLCGRIDIPQPSDDDVPQADDERVPRGPVDIEVIDMYGNKHTCRLEFVTGTRDQLRFL